MRIFLIGFMGAGKTSLGRQLADKLSLPFVDTDLWIENQSGLSIPEIFAKKGETTFRAMEREALQKLIASDAAVISCGGGLPCHSRNMETMLQFGRVIYLKISPDELLLRLTRNGTEKRPLLADKTQEELKTWIHQKLTEREACYLQAHHILCGDCLNAEDILCLPGLRNS